MPQSYGHTIWVSAIVWPFITGIFLALRLYCKLFLTRRLALNDYVAFATLPFIITFSVTISEASYNGAGDHMSDFTKQLNERYYFWVLVASEFYAASLMGYKVALLLLYLSIFNVYKYFRWCCYITMAYVIAYLSCNIITEVAGCQPVAKFWDPSIPGHCINSTAADIAYGINHVISDLIIAVLPLPMVWRLKMRHKRDKIGLALVLSSGGIALCVAIARYTVSDVDLVSSDRSYIAGLNWILSIAEINTGLICGCTPALKPLFRVAKEATREYSRKLSYGLTSDKLNNNSRSGSRGFIELLNLGSRKSKDDRNPSEPTTVDHKISNPIPILTTDTAQNHITIDTDTWAKYTNEEILGAEKEEGEGESRSGRVEDVETGRLRSDSQVSPTRMSPVRMTSEELFEGTQLAHKNSRTALVDFQKIDTRLGSNGSRGRTGKSR